MQLIKKGKAYVCDLTADQIREYRGTLTEPGKDSPYRNRTVEENLDLFARMQAGEFPDGARTLRAKIDMASPNLNMRDPVMYRILHAEHHRTGDKWCIYPMYDWAHGQSDSIEGITHSICTLEFENHRPLYDWYHSRRRCGIYHPQQIEFARLNLTYTVHEQAQAAAAGAGRPRAAAGTTRACRRSPACAAAATRPRPSATSASASASPSSTASSTFGWLEDCVREDLNKRAPRVMAVLRPLKVVIDNYPEGQVEELDAVNNPEDPAAGTRKVPFSRVLYIEQDDFREDPPKDFFRLAPGREVRLRYAYFIKCTSVVKDAARRGHRSCTAPTTRPRAAATPPDGRKVKGTIHWVSAAHAVAAEVRLYDHLFTQSRPRRRARRPGLHRQPEPELAGSAHRLQARTRAWPTPPPARATSSSAWATSASIPIPTPGKPVFNRTVTLKDTWAKIEKRGKQPK